MSDTYQPSPLTGAPVATTGYMQPARPVTPTPPAPATSTTYAPSFSYGPSDINTALIKAGAPPSVAPTLTAITGAESGFGKNQVSGVNKDGSRDYGLGQINGKAWPGLNPPNLVHAPLDQQAAAIVHVYNHQGLTAWSTYKDGSYKKYLGQVGSTAPTGAVSSAPSVPSVPSAQPGDNLAMLAALSQPSGGGQKSPMDNLSSMASGGGDQPQVQNNLQGQQAAAAGNIRQQQIAQRAAQLSAGLAQYAAQPLSWGAAPMGSTAGPQRPLMPQAGQQQTPGVTLNSMGGQYV